MGYVVYVLECRHGKYYVGRCAHERLRARLWEHRDPRCGGGCRWTAMYPGIKMMSAKASEDPLDEDRKVLEMMRTHGIANVRGGSYCNATLTPEQVASLQRQLDHAAGRCIKCGGQGHWAQTCPNTSYSCTYTPGTCFRCGTPGHWANHCFARLDGDDRI